MYCVVNYSNPFVYSPFGPTHSTSASERCHTYSCLRDCINLLPETIAGNRTHNRTVAVSGDHEASLTCTNGSYLYQRLLPVPTAPICTSSNSSHLYQRLRPVLTAPNCTSTNNSHLYQWHQPVPTAPTCKVYETMTILRLAGLKARREIIRKSALFCI